MSLHTLLAELRRRDIRVRADGERLMVNAPPGALVPELQEQLRRQKQEVLQFLRTADELTKQHWAIVPLQPCGPRPPIFGVPGGNGDVFCFLYLAGRLGTDQPLYGLQPPGLDGRSEPLNHIEELAAYFVRQIAAFYPEGPLVVTGFCAGGMTAFEVGRLLARQRRNVAVVLLGAPHPTTYRRLAIAPALMQEQWARFARWMTTHRRTLASLSTRDKWSYITERLRRQTKRSGASTAPDPVLALRAKVEFAALAGARRYTPGQFDGRLSIFVPSRASAQNREKQLRWRSAAPECLVFFGPDGCTRDEMLHEPYVGSFADQLRACASEAVPDPAAV